MDRTYKILKYFAWKNMYFMYWLQFYIALGVVR